MKANRLGIELSPIESVAWQRQPYLAVGPVLRGLVGPLRGFRSARPYRSLRLEGEAEKGFLADLEDLAGLEGDLGLGIGQFIPIEFDPALGDEAAGF